MGEEVFSKWGDHNIYIRILVCPSWKGLLALAVAAGGVTFSDLQEATNIIGAVMLICVKLSHGKVKKLQHCS